MATTISAPQTAIANLYVALFNRAPDAAGFGFWVQSLSNGALLPSITSAFLGSPESRAIYPSSQTSEQFITSFYTTVFGRTPDATGLAFWAGVVNANGGSSSDAAKAVAVAQIINVVSTLLTTKPADITDAQFAQTVADRATFTNKVIVGTYYAVDAKGTSVDIAKVVLSGVNNTDASVVAAKAIADSATNGGTVGDGSTNVGTTFTGVVGADSFTGTGANDTFNFLVDQANAANSTLSAVDKVAGGAGIDTLNITTVGAPADVLNSADVSGIETIAIRATTAGSTSTLATVPTGVTTVSVGGSGNVTVGNGTTSFLASGAKFAIAGVSGAATYVVNYAAAATSATVTLSGGQTSTGTLTVNGAGLTSATITGSNGANVLAGVALAGTVKTLTVDAQSALTTGAITGFATDAAITVTGAGVANIGELAANVATVTATGNTGGLTATLSLGTQKITGSAGVDTITTGGLLLTTGSVDAGAGTADTLIVTSTTDLATAALGAKFTNFEIVQANNGVTVDMDNIAGITGVRVNDIAGNTGFVNLSAAQAAAVTIVATDGAGVTLGVKGATTGGQIDTVKAALFTTTAGAASAVDLTGITLAGVEKLELTGNGTAAGTTGLITLDTTNATSLDSIIVKNIGGASITVAGAHTATNLNIDASGSAGVVTVNAAAYATTTGVTIKGGSGTNTLTGSANSDIIVGGSGNDTINGGVFASGGVAGVTENNTVAWGAFATPAVGMQNIGGATVTSDGFGTFTAAQVAAVAAGGAVAGLWLTAPTLWTITASGTPGQSLFTSTTPNTNVTNITNPSAFGSGAPPSVVLATPGVAAIAGTDTGSTDTLTGGGGADTFVFSTADLDTTVARVTAIITDFVTGTDKIQVSNGGAGAGSATTFVKAAAVAADLATLLTAADTALAGAVKYYVGQFGADSYLVTDGDGLGYTNVIKLLGVALTGIVAADLIA